MLFANTMKFLEKKQEKDRRHIQICLRAQFLFICWAQYIGDNKTSAEVTFLGSMFSPVYHIQP